MSLPPDIEATLRALIAVLDANDAAQAADRIAEAFDLDRTPLACPS